MKENSIKLIMKIIQIILYTIILANEVWSEPDRHCLNCICEASTGCKDNIQCHNNGAGQYYCGPYQISWAYWADAGKPGDAGFPNDFETCLVKKSCAEATVRGYMAKWGNDCNGDGHVDCLDYAAIHKTGPVNSCQQNWLLDSKYWTQFQQCYQQKNSSGSISTNFSDTSSSSLSSSSPSSSSARDVSPNQPSNSIIEIPRPTRTLRPGDGAGHRRTSNPAVFGPPLPPPLPPVIARASASVPGISASASASAGFEPNGDPITFASASTSHDDDDDDDIHGLLEIAEFSSNRLTPRTGRIRANNHLHRHNQVPPLPGPFNKPLSSAIFVPSSNYKPVPTRIVFPGPQSPPRPPSPSPIVNRNNNDYNNHHDSNNILVTSRPINVPKPDNKPIIEIVEHNPSSPPSLSSSPGSSEPPLVPYDCLHCLCHASSKCDLNKGCDGAYCGPYLLSWGYWADGGQPGTEYAQCSKQKQCSEIAIQGYMGKWKRDCNRDGVIDCVDFALIHKLGPHGCGQLQALEASDYWRQFNECHTGRNKPARSARPALVEVPQPSFHSGPNDRLIGPEPRPRQPEHNIVRPQPRGFNNNNDEDDTEEFTIRVNNRNDRINPNLREIPTRDPFEEPARTRIDLSNFNRSRPIIIRIKPPADDTNHDNNHNNRPVLVPKPPPPPPLPAPRPTPVPSRPQSRPVTNRPILRPIEDEEVIINSQPPRPSHPGPFNIRNDNDNFFNLPRPSNEDGPNERPNVFEIPRPRPPPPPQPSPPVDEERSQPRPTPVPSRPPNRQNLTNELVSQECLECLCYASSKCSSSIGCRSEGNGKYICGPYQVDWEYWAEAGKPGNRADLSNLENFQMCLNNRDCADRTVREYMQRWRKDCNEDGTIDCNDFAAIHVAGPNQCGAQWYLDSKYYSDFRECFDF